MRNLFSALRPLLRDLAPTLLLILVWRATGELTLGIVAGIGCAVLHLGWTLIRRRKIETLQWLSLFTTLGAGAAAVLTGNSAFILWKPTVVMAAVGAAMLRPAWQQAYLPPVAREHVSRGSLVLWGYVWSALLFGCAAMSAALAWMHRETAWAWFNGVGTTALQIALFALQYVTMRGQVVRAQTREA